MEGEKMVAKIGGVDVDFTDLVPFTMGDKKRMKAAPYSIDFANIQGRDPDTEIRLLLYIVHRKMPEATVEHIEELPMVIGQKLIVFATNRAAEVDKDFLKLSTPLPGTTGGESTK